MKIKKGSRRRVLYPQITGIVKRGYPLAKSIEVALKLNQQIMEEPLSESAIVTEVQRAYSRHKGKS